MLDQQKKVIEIITRYIPHSFGIKSAYYKLTEEGLEFIFFVNEKNAGNVISFIRALSNMIEKEVGDIKIQSNIYIEDKKDIRGIIQRNEMKELVLKPVLSAA